jgi:hypothetical protein
MEGRGKKQTQLSDPAFTNCGSAERGLCDDWCVKDNSDADSDDTDDSFSLSASSDDSKRVCGLVVLVVAVTAVALLSGDVADPPALFPAARCM